MVKMASSPEHTGPLPLKVAGKGIGNIASLVNDADDPEVQVTFPAVTV